MVGVMIDQKLCKLEDKIRYTFRFLFETLGINFKFINSFNELQNDDILFIYTPMEFVTDEITEIINKRVTFYVKAEFELYQFDRLNFEEIRDKLYEIPLQDILPVLSSSDISVPVSTIKKGEFVCGKFNFDIIGNIFFHISYYEERITETIKEERRVLEITSPFTNYQRFPYVNVMLWMIDNFMNELVVKSSNAFMLKKCVWPEDEDFAYSVSYNINRLTKWTLIKLIKSIPNDFYLFFSLRWNLLFKLAIEKLYYLVTNVECYWKFDLLANILTDKKIKGTYFFGAVNKPNDKIDYTLNDNDLLEEVANIVRDKNEIALLYDSEDIDYSGQTKTLSLKTNRTIKGIRNIRFREEILEQKNSDKFDFLYESTCSTIQRTGFPNGIAYPYFTYNENEKKNHLELPISFSDYLMQINSNRSIKKDKAKDAIKSQVLTINETNGLLVLDFSISRMNDISYNRDLLEYAIGLIQDRKAYNGTLSEIADWWQKRYAVTMTENGDEIIISVPAGLEKISFRCFGNRQVKEVKGAVMKQKNGLITLTKLSKDGIIAVYAPIEEQINLSFETEDIDS